MKTGEGKRWWLLYQLSKRINEERRSYCNDYLANRDQVSMGQIYRFLGLDTGLIQDGMSTSERREIIKRILHM
jgi:preprotein translocase subunit SecA